MIAMHPVLFVLAFLLGTYSYLGLFPFRKANPYVVAPVIWILFYSVGCAYQGQALTAGGYYLVLAIIVLLPLQVILAAIVVLLWGVVRKCCRWLKPPAGNGHQE